MSSLKKGRTTTLSPTLSDRWLFGDFTFFSEHQHCEISGVLGVLEFQSSGFQIQEFHMGIQIDVDQRAKKFVNLYDLVRKNTQRHNRASFLCDELNPVFKKRSPCATF